MLTVTAKMTLSMARPPFTTMARVFIALCWATAMPCIFPTWIRCERAGKSGWFMKLLPLMELPAPKITRLKKAHKFFFFFCTHTTLRAGREIWMVHETPSAYGPTGLEYRDAKTGALIFGLDGQNADVGRGVAYD